MPYKHSELYTDNKFDAAALAPNFQMFMRNPNEVVTADQVGCTDITEILKKYFSPDWGIVLQSGSLTTAIPVQAFGPREVPYNMTLSSCEMVAIPITGETTGDIVVDVWVDSYANYPPVVGDSIVGSGVKPTIAGALKSNDTDLTDWTTLNLTKGSKALFNVVSCSNLCVVAIKFPNVRTA